jgi:hypothetical protein
MRREPALAVCTACGRMAVILDASDRAWLAQHRLDRERRGRSIECTPPFNGATWSAPRRVLNAAVRPGPRLPVARS